MFKNKVFIVFTIMVTAIAALALSCAPAAAPEKPATTTPAAPATPAATAPAAPAAPAAAAAPAVASVPSLPTQLEAADAVKFVDTENGFSIWYPKNWVDYGPGAFSKSRQATPGYDAIAVNVETKTTEMIAQLKNDFANTPSMKNYGVEVIVNSSGPIKLLDGTMATEISTTCNLAGGLYVVSLYTIGVEKGGKYIFATGSTLSEGRLAAIKQVVQTFSLDTK